VVCPLISSVLHAFFFFNSPATTEIYTLSLHDALPISPECEEDQGRGSRRGGGRKEQHAEELRVCPDRSVGHGQQHTGVARDEEAEGRAHEGEHLAERAVEEHAQTSPADASLVCERADRRGRRNPAEEEERPGADRHW